MKFISTSVATITLLASTQFSVVAQTGTQRTGEPIQGIDIILEEDPMGGQISRTACNQKKWVEVKKDGKKFAWNLRKQPRSV